MFIELPSVRMTSLSTFAFIMAVKTIDEGKLIKTASNASMTMFASKIQPKLRQ